MQANPLPALFLTALATPLAAQSPVWIVDDDGGPGVDFTTLDQAQAGAADGDILVFRPGVYMHDGFTATAIDGKGLTLVADGDVELHTLVVQNLGVGQALTVRGFKCYGGVRAYDSSGPIWLEELAVSPPGTPYCQVLLENCSSVALNRCNLQGFPALPFFNTSALGATQSTLHVYDSQMKGGAGSAVFAAEDGLILGSSFVFLSGALLLGGDPTATGGVQHGTSESILLDTLGTYAVFGGTKTVLPGTSRSFEATALAREGELVTMAWTGAPSELAVLGLSTAPGGHFFGALNGSVVIGPLILSSVIGPLPGAGTLSHSVAIPELGAGVEGAVFYAQGAFADLASGSVRLGGGSAIVLLDQSL